MKGRLRVYKKVMNDELRDTNSRRRERRFINQGQRQQPPTQSDKVNTQNLRSMGAALPSIKEEQDDAEMKFDVVA